MRVADGAEDHEALTATVLTSPDSEGHLVDGDQARPGEFGEGIVYHRCEDLDPVLEKVGWVLNLRSYRGRRAGRFISRRSATEAPR
jgi:hypothetical protein